MIFLWLVGAAVFASFFLIVLRGAPYVPTHTTGIENIFELYDFSHGEVLVDLGSGDGRVLQAVARRGVTAVGYELNPFLVWYSRIRLRGLPQASVRLDDFWRVALPDQTAVVFVFLAHPFMNKLLRKLDHEAARLGRPIILMSYGMELPGHTPWRKKGGLLAYRITP